MNITVENLFEAGVHLGHQMRRCNSKAKNYIYERRNGIAIIDLEQTYACLERACEFVESLVSTNKTLLLLGTKKQAQGIVREAAQATNLPYCANRWLGGNFTNFSTIKRSLEKYKRLLAMEADGSINKMPKKELAAVRRDMVRMERNFDGILTLDRLPAALIVVDTHKEAIAVEEAKRLKIPIIGIIDTNADPTGIDYPIPANDDAVKSIRIIMDALVEAVKKGVEAREARAEKMIANAALSQKSAFKSQEVDESRGTN